MQYQSPMEEKQRGSKVLHVLEASSDGLEFLNVSIESFSSSVVSSLLIYTKSNRTTNNIPPKAVIFSDFSCTFAMSLMILPVLICSTKVSEKSDMTKSWAARLCRLPQQELFVAQVLIKKVKLKCCGI